MEKTISKVIDFNTYEGKLKDYQFLLSSILGKYDEVPIEKPFIPSKRYSIDDAIYSLIREINTSGSSEDLISIKEFKKKQEDFLLLEKETGNEVTEQDDQNEELNNKDSELEQTRKSILNEQKNIRDYVINYSEEIRRNNLRNKINDFRKNSQGELKKNLETKKKKKQELKRDFKRKNCLFQFFGKKTYQRELDEFEREINDLNSQIENYDDRNLVDILDEFYGLKENIQKKYHRLLKGIEDLKNLHKTYEGKLNSLPYIDYVFVRNILSEKKMKAYERGNRKSWQKNIEPIYKILFKDSLDQQKSFSNLIDNKIDAQVENIIDFKMTKYLTHQYEDLNLFKNWDFEKGIEDLKECSLPFFNATGGYSHNSHNLICFDDADKSSTDGVNQSLKENYTGTIPGHFSTNSPHKFILFSFEVVNDLNDVVKYNLKTES